MSGCLHGQFQLGVGATFMVSFSCGVVACMHGLFGL